MKKFFPLILAITVGLGGFFYFNHNEISQFDVKNVYIYNYDEYKDKNPSPFVKLEKKNLIDIVVETINSSNNTKRELNMANPNYVLDVLYSKNKKKTFHLWLNENTTIGMYKNRDNNHFLILSKEDTTRLKTLMFR